MQVAEVMLCNNEHGKYGNPVTERRQVYLLLRNDDDRCVQVHLYVDRLVSLQGILQPGSCFLANAFEGFTGGVLGGILITYPSLNHQTYQECSK